MRCGFENGSTRSATLPNLVTHGEKSGGSDLRDLFFRNIEPRCSVYLFFAARIRSIC
jgi:hypothetical protein